MLNNLRKKDKWALFLPYQDVEKSTFKKITKTMWSKKAWDILGTISKLIKNSYLIFQVEAEHEERLEHFRVFLMINHRTKDKGAPFLLSQRVYESIFEKIAETMQSTKAWDILGTISNGG